MPPTSDRATPDERPPAGGTWDDDGRRRSGTAFVLVCAALCVALVLVFVFVSPRLLEATLERAPDPAPVEVAAGEAGGTPWRVTAVEPEEERPCAELRADGSRALLVCGDRRGVSNVRGLDGLGLGDAAVVTAIVDPRSTEVAVEHAGGTARTEVVYADFGFPLGFAAVEVEPPVEAVGAYGEDGELRGHADCRLDGADHDPDRHPVPPVVVGTGEVLGGGCLLTD